MSDFVRISGDYAVRASEIIAIRAANAEATTVAIWMRGEREPKYALAPFGPQILAVLGVQLVGSVQ